MRPGDVHFVRLEKADQFVAIPWTHVIGGPAVGVVPAAEVQPRTRHDDERHMQSDWQIELHADIGLRDELAAGIQARLGSGRRLDCEPELAAHACIEVDGPAAGLALRLHQGCCDVGGRRFDERYFEERRVHAHRGIVAG